MSRFLSEFQSPVEEKWGSHAPQKLEASASTWLLVEAMCPASWEQGENQLTQNYKRQSIWIIFRLHSKKSVPMSHWSFLLWRSLVNLVVASMRWDGATWATAASKPEDLPGKPEAALFLPLFSPEVAWLVSDSDVITWKVVAMVNGSSKTCFCWLFLMRGSLSSCQANGKRRKERNAQLC